MSEIEKRDVTPRLRGVVLELLYDNHCRQQSRLDLVTLGGALTRLFYDIPLNDLAMLLQDLKERGCVDFQTERNRWTGRTRIAKIEIKPRGRDLVEGTVKEPGVVVNE